jgi:hypothetical protein
MNRQPSEQAARLSRRQSNLLALDLDLQRSKQSNEHREASVTGLGSGIRAV